MSKRPAPKSSPLSRIDPALETVVIEEDHEVREEIGKTITALMPWGISILAHVALIVLAFFLVWQTIVQQPDPPIVEARITPAPAVPSMLNEVEDPTKDKDAGGGFIVPVVSEVRPVEIVAPGFDLPVPVIPQDSYNDGLNNFDGPGKDDDGGKSGLKPGSAKEVVFLIDASGSMVDVLPFVIEELKQVVNDMQPVVVNGKTIDTKATVIFFSGKGVFEVPGGGGVRGLRAMTPPFKRQVHEWVALENFHFGTGGRGTAYVGDAVARALSYKPQLVILLSDNLTGGGQGATQYELMQDDLIALINKHNDHQPPARFNTIQFLYEDPLVRAGLKGTLHRIAEETGGTFRFIPQSELNLR